VIPALFGVLRGRQPVPVGLSLKRPRLDRGGQGRADEPVMDAGRQRDGERFGDDVPQAGLVKRPGQRAAPTCCLNLAIRCRWLQPTSSAIRLIGTAPSLATSRRQAQPTSGEGRGPLASRRRRNWSIAANRCRQVRVSRSCSARRRPAGPNTSARSTSWPLSSSMSKPRSV
jgi:hypothetical protein